MTKQSYEKPNMEIVMLEDVIKTSGGSSHCTFFCSPDSSVCDSAIVCNPDFCSSDISCAVDGWNCPRDNGITNQTGYYCRVD